MSDTAVCVVSGGLDSVTLTHWVVDREMTPVIVSFDYGQRHRRELAMAEACAKRFDAEWVLVPMSFLGPLLDSALTNPEAEMPHGHYAAENMKLTVVPNRNAIMLAIAWGLAVSRGAKYVATGVHGGDHFIYPDCRPEFIRELEEALRLGNKGFGHPDMHLLTPFNGLTKADIVSIGSNLGVPFGLTWSCYEGSSVHCGKCGTCVERKEAFQLAGVVDPTPYEGN